MKSISFGRIFLKKDSLNVSSELKLCKKNIGFLNPILKQTTAIQQNEDFSSMIVTFFYGSRFEKTLCYEELSTLAELYTSKEILKKDLKITSDNCLSRIVIATDVKENIDNNLLKNCSWYIRNSETLKVEDFTLQNNEFRSIDGRGMVLLTKYPDDERYQACRGIFLTMLGLAYYLALQQVSEELAFVLKDTNNIEELNKLYTEATVFNARYYFHNPIEFSRYPTFQAWEEVRNTYQLAIKNKEVISQLGQVHGIISRIQEKVEQQDNDRKNLKLTLLGIVLSLFGLVEVIDTLINWFE
ncbi:hypothetical protein [Otariodibacter sp.]|uniref:hypothetical protein n=1 Tax=Otariodibacter sp. TaxID=3030919 RepID=UPI002631556A|nr:hypothetical protein [Otariodibacter sp.]